MFFYFVLCVYLVGPLHPGRLLSPRVLHASPHPSRLPATCVAPTPPYPPLPPPTPHPPRQATDIVSCSGGVCVLDWSCHASPPPPLPHSLPLPTPQATDIVSGAEVAVKVLGDGGVEAADTMVARAHEAATSPTPPHCDPPTPLPLPHGC